MKLAGIKVLLDAYNLSLGQGTGIKNYGLTMIKSLKQLEANVNILFGKNYRHHKNSLLNEVLFFDNGNYNQSKFLLSKDLLKAASSIYYSAKRVSINDVVLRDPLLSEGFDNDFVGAFNLSECYRISNLLFGKFGLPTRVNINEKIDIWHATYPLPVRVKNAKKITTIHDLIPLRLPYTSLDDKVFTYKNIKNSIKDSDLIVTVSQNSKNDIISLFGTNPDKIHITYQTTNLDDFHCNSDDLAAVLKQHNLKANNYILFVGAIEPKKNVGRLIDAHALIEPEYKIPLVIVGKKAWMWENDIGKLENIYGKRFTKKVKLLEHIPKNTLKYLYKGASCLVFPSLYEGFGLPPLEAMTFGCPVITSNVASLPEVCGNSALYVDPYDVFSIKNAISQVLRDRELWNHLSKAGQERAKLFSLESYSERLYEAYTKVL